MPVGLKITKYADRLLEDLELLVDQIIEIQKNWIGKSKEQSSTLMLPIKL